MMAAVVLKRIAGLYVVTEDCREPLRCAEVAAAAAAGGAWCVQLRSTRFSERDLLRAASAIRDTLSGSGTLFLVNNRVDIALASEADGVHVGQDDLPAALLRGMLGPEAIVGVSVGNVTEAESAEADGASYVAIGPIYATSTKEDAGEPVGLAPIKAIRRAVGIPVVAIGGITLANIRDVRAAGADAAALVGAVSGASDMVEAVKALVRQFEKGIP